MIDRVRVLLRIRETHLDSAEFAQPGAAGEQECKVAQKKLRSRV